MGQFGRVYEAVTLGLPHLPPRVAVKVSRKDGRVWQHILENEDIMRTATDLSSVAHLMRQYDGGRLRKPNVPYHVLQLIDGETVDHLPASLVLSMHQCWPRPVPPLVLLLRK